MRRLFTAALVTAALAFTGGTIAPADAAAPAAETKSTSTHSKRVVFKAFGDDPKARVEVYGRTDIERMRNLPYKKVTRLSGSDLDFGFMAVEDAGLDYDRVGCKIKVNGRTVSRSVSRWGSTICYVR